MAIISLKRYLDGFPTDSYQRMLGLLVDTLSQHPVDIDPLECERFKGEMLRIQERFPADANGDEFVLSLGAVTQALERHNRSVGNIVHRQSDELQHMIAMLTQTIQSLGSASDTSTRNLESIALQLKRASALEDIQLLRLRLGECLKRVRDEAVRQRQQSQGNLQTLKHELASSQQRLSRHGIEADVDRVTGFAGRTAAEVALHEAADANDSLFVAVAVLGKMQAINARFGYVVGDEVLCEFAARVAGRLCSNAAFYRWSGPTIIGILKRSNPLQVVRTEVSRVVETPISKSLVTGGQNAFITTSAAWLVLSAVPPASELIAQIDAFVAKQIPTEHAIEVTTTPAPQSTA